MMRFLPSRLAEPSGIDEPERERRIVLAAELVLHAVPMSTRRTDEAVVTRVGLALAGGPRLLRHRVGEGVDFVLGIDVGVERDRAVDRGVALVGIEAVHFGLCDEVEDTLHPSALRAFDVRVEPLHEPPPANRCASHHPRVRDAFADAVGVQRPIRETALAVRLPSYCGGLYDFHASTIGPCAPARSIWLLARRLIRL